MLRSLVSAAVVTAAAALAPHPAAAASAAVNVPFSFTVSGKQCPAGVYNIQLEQMNQVIRLSNPVSRVNLEWLAGPGDPDPTDRRVVLRFDRAGSSYALHSIQYGAQITSQIDKKIRSQQPPTEVFGQ